MSVTKEEARDMVLSSNGRIFSVWFVTRKERRKRRLIGRLGVTSFLKNGTLPFDSKDHNLIGGICDLEAVRRLKILAAENKTEPVYRNVPWDAIFEICVDGRREKVI